MPPTDGGGDVVCRVSTESFAAQLFPRLRDTWAVVTPEMEVTFRRILEASARQFHFRDGDSSTKERWINSSITKENLKGEDWKLKKLPHNYSIFFKALLFTP